MPAIVSILTPSFNRDDLVTETLESVLAQSYPHWEMLVVDDGSTDRTKDIVAEYALRDSRMRLFDRTWSPKGACTCRNEGVAMCKGEYVLFLDTDDIIEPFCLANRVAAMDANPELDFAIFPSLMFEHKPYDLNRWWNIDKPDDELSRQFRQDAIAQGTGVMWRKEAFVRVGMWSTDLLIWQDIDLFFRAYILGFRYGKFFELAPDLHNRVSHESLSRSDFFSPGKLASRVRVVKSAVALLAEQGLERRVPEARFMTAEICTGAARSGHPAVALDMLRWASRTGVLSAREALRLALAVGLYLAPTARLATLARAARALERPFQATSTLGILPYHHDALSRAGLDSLG